MSGPITNYIAYFETLTPQALDLLDRVFSSTARFKDPFNDVQGIEAIRGVFEDMYERCDTPRFVVGDVACDGDTCFIGWTFTFRAGNRDLSIDGASRVRFDAAGKAVEHIDYWDAASQVYERIPLLGGLLRTLRRKLSAGQTTTSSTFNERARGPRQRGIGA